MIVFFSKCIINNVWIPMNYKTPFWWDREKLKYEMKGRQMEGQTDGRTKDEWMDGLMVRYMKRVFILVLTKCAFVADIWNEGEYNVKLGKIYYNTFKRGIMYIHRLQRQQFPGGIQNKWKSLEARKRRRKSGLMIKLRSLL